MNAIYKKVDIVGTSSVGFSDAIQAAVAEAGRTLRGMSWFEVIEQRGGIRDGKIAEYQVTVRIGFKIER